MLLFVGPAFRSRPLFVAQTSVCANGANATPDPPFSDSTVYLECGGSTPLCRCYLHDRLTNEHLILNPALLLFLCALCVSAVDFSFSEIAVAWPYFFFAGFFSAEPESFASFVSFAAPSFAPASFFSLFIPSLFSVAAASFAGLFPA